MFKFLSDVETAENNFMVEWEYSDGGRFWQLFDSEEEMNAAIATNQSYNDSHKEEVDAIHLESELWLIRHYETEYDEQSGYLMPYQVEQVLWYKKCVAENTVITMDLYNAALNEIAAKLNANKN